MNMLNSTQVAYVLGVHPSAVSNWRAGRSPCPIPDPVYVDGRVKLWLARDIAPIAEAKRAEIQNKLSDMELAANTYLNGGIT